MGRGLLKVLLVDAKGLAGNDFLGEPVESPPRTDVLVLASPICSVPAVSGGGWTLIDLFVPRCAGRLDPYVVVQYRSQERKSSAARGQSSHSSPILNSQLHNR
jgi:hypothetical protein